MRKILMTVVAFTLFMAMSVNALAASTSGESDVTASRVHIADAIDNNAFPESSQRAIVAPTSYAPTSWYNVKHNWTCTSYTYSSYFFDTSEYPYLDVAADVPFTVELYYANGTYMGSVSPEYDSEKGKYYGAYFFYADEDYYMIIRNNSNAAITSGAWYLVGDVF
ncbi:MAG: hypothetical protein LUG83_07905 [Lachnospiraceae bacterium]|nr:hypothetical protein [Lachnospiraceae bacterium]